MECGIKLLSFVAVSSTLCANCALKSIAEIQGKPGEWNIVDGVANTIRWLLLLRVIYGGRNDEITLSGVDIIAKDDSFYLTNSMSNDPGPQKLLKAHNQLKLVGRIISCESRKQSWGAMGRQEWCVRFPTGHSRRDIDTWSYPIICCTGCTILLCHSSLGCFQEGCCYSNCAGIKLVGLPRRWLVVGRVSDLSHGIKEHHISAMPLSEKKSFTPFQAHRKWVIVSQSMVGGVEETAVTKLRYCRPMVQSHLWSR